MRRANLATAFVFSAASIVGAVQQTTLAERVRQQRGNIEVLLLNEYSPVQLRELIKACDLLVRVVVSDNGHSYLTKDAQDIESEFTVQVIDRYLLSPVLRPAEKILITLHGGTLTIDGYPITSRENDFPPFHPNEEYILMLKHDSSTGQYLLPYGAQGAFRIIGGEVEQVSQQFGTWNRERGRVPVVDFIKELTSLIPAG